MERALLRGGDGAPGLIAAGISFVALVLLFVGTGAFAPGHLPHYATSERQVIGMALMLIGIPTYLLVVWTISQQRSLRLVDALEADLPDPRQAEEARRAIRTALRRTWRWGAVIGIALGLLNTSPLEAYRSDAPAVAMAISIGQLSLWLVIGLLLSVRSVTAVAFRELARQVDFDLFQLVRLRPLAQNGMRDLLIIAGAILFTPLQSLDAEFRWVNYQFTVFIGLPASAFLLFWPQWPIHRRLVTNRKARIAALDVELKNRKASPANLDLEDTLALETLLAHRDRLSNARTWPVDLRLLSWAVFYVVMPPLAWAGAALVEKLVDRFLSGAP